MEEKTTHDYIREHLLKDIVFVPFDIEDKIRFDLFTKIEEVLG